MGDVLQAKVVDLLNGLSQGIGKYGPEALDLMLQGVYWHSLFSLIIGGVLFAAFLVLLVVFFKKTFPWAIQHDVSDECGSFAVMVNGVAGIAALVVSLCLLFNIWNWIGVYSPKVALAHQIIEMMTGSK